MSGPRVLHVVTDTDRRGAQLAGLALHDQLTAHAWDSRIVALQPGARGDLAVEALGTRARRLATLARLRSAGADADVVVAHGSTTLPAAAIGLRGRTPFVYVNIGDPRAWLTTAARRVRTRVFLRRAAAVAAISPQSASVLKEWVGLAPDRIRVLPNFRDPTVFHPLGPKARKLARDGLGWPRDRPVVLWMGALTPEKRPDLALEVAAAMPDADVVLAGDGPLAPSLRPRAEQVGARMLGVVEQPSRWLAAADVLLITSDTEGVPGVLIEAGMCEVPAVSTDVGFVGDVVLDGCTGRLVPRGDVPAMVDAIRQCVDSREVWGAAARGHCRSSFATDQVVPSWQNLLRSVAAGAR